jgi:hypothetical protein
VKDLEKLLEASMIVDVGRFDVDSILLFKIKCSKNV